MAIVMADTRYGDFNKIRKISKVTDWTRFLVQKKTHDSIEEKKSKRNKDFSHSKREQIFLYIILKAHTIKRDPRVECCDGTAIVIIKRF